MYAMGRRKDGSGRVSQGMEPGLKGPLAFIRKIFVGIRKMRKRKGRFD
jgi:hypothetical protein